MVSLARVEPNKILTADLSLEEAERVVKAQRAADKILMEVDHRPRLSLSQIRSEARKAHRKHGRLGAIVVDFLTLMYDDPKYRDKRLSVDNNLDGLKALASELKTGVILLAQINRTSLQKADRRPQMEDLKESGGIEEKADIVALLHREEYYHRLKPPAYEEDDSASERHLKEIEWQEKLRAVEGIAELNMAKIKLGESGVRRLRFVSKSVDFEELVCR